MRLVRGLLAGGLALVLFAGTAEVAVRLIHPAPRVQVIREDVLGPEGFRVVDGVVTWEQRVSPKRREVGCAPGDRTVLLVGSSILWGSGVDDDEPVSVPLEARLEASDPGWCVRNHAEPAFAGEQKVATGLEAVARHNPGVVVWEVWTNDLGHFELLGETAYNVGLLQVDAGGRPLAFPVPPALHGPLFASSRAWSYLHTTLAPELDEEARRALWEAWFREGLPDVRRRVEAAGARVVFVLAPELDRPFEATAARHRHPDHPYALLADPGDLPVHDLAALLAGRDVELLRVDTCCHFSPAGHVALAEVLAPLVLGAAEVGGDAGNEPPRHRGHRE